MTLDKSRQQPKRDRQQPVKPHSKEWVDHVCVLLESIGGPKALAVYICLRNGGIYQTTQLSIDPLDYDNPRRFAQDWQALRLLAKCDFLTDPKRAKEKALASFKEAEERCRLTNRRLSDRMPIGRSGRILRLARKMILSLIGETPKDLLEVITDNAKWGGGSTSSCKGRFTQRYNKLGSDAEYTPSLEPYLPALRECWWYPQGAERAVRGNKVSTVPKSFKTDRTIATEPTINSALQRAVGLWFREKLLAWGVSTRDQTRNQRLALRGSRDGKLSTMDLSMASDTISLMAVRELLPLEWVRLLDTLRSPMYYMDGEWRYYNKHSSMGNGYTFELETLIFSAITYASTMLYAGGGPWSVYGDDIVCLRSVDPYVRGALRAMGFVVGREKSFRKGLFRESCGEEFFGGERCTPYYARHWKKPVSWSTLANYIRLEAWAWDERKRAWLATLHLCPRPLRLKGPLGVLGVFACNQEEVPDVARSLRVKSGRIGYVVEGLHFVAQTRPLEGGAGLDEMQRRLAERGGIPELPWLPFLAPPDRDNTARELGRWVRRPVLVEDWPVVPGLT